MSKILKIIVVIIISLLLTGTIDKSNTVSDYDIAKKLTVKTGSEQLVDTLRYCLKECIKARKASDTLVIEIEKLKKLNIKDE